jgi:hypothetical protein
MNISPNILEHNLHQYLRYAVERFLRSSLPIAWIIGGLNIDKIPFHKHRFTSLECREAIQ